MKDLQSIAGHPFHLVTPIRNDRDRDLKSSIDEPAPACSYKCQSDINTVECKLTYKRFEKKLII
jgi:hypothetical protein